MNFKKYKCFFPRKVYYCSCVKSIIISCLLDGMYSLENICNEICEVNDPVKKIYCTKCGNNNQNVIFSCTAHMPMVIIEQTTIGDIYCSKKKKINCRICIKKYLQKMYYCYQHTHFDLPMQNKKFH